MNKKGMTILEILASITIISLVVLLLIKVILSLGKINNDPNYASNDEINRAILIKNIENDFLNLKLNGLNIIEKANETTVNFKYENTSKSLVIFNNSITYNDISYPLGSANATYDLCPSFTYSKLANNSYLINLNIPVLIEKKNTANIDDITLTYLGLTNNTTNYPLNYICSKK